MFTTESFRDDDDAIDVPSRPVPESLWEKVNCNLCGSEKHRVRYAGTTDPDTARLLHSYSASANFVSEETLVECERCTLVFTSPRLRRDLILKSYEESNDPLYVSQADGRIKSFERCMRAVSRFQALGKVLDVGAAAGFFLKVAKDLGWQTFGIEPSRYLSSYGNENYDVNIRCGTLDSVSDIREMMDVVTLWDVLEHTFDPKATLARCNQYLRRDGIIVVNYPNIGNWLARLAGRKYWFILSVHLYYFTPQTIKRMLEDTGFEVLEQAPHFQWLGLGYLLYRLEAYLPGPAKIAGKIAKACGLAGILIPYFAAQTRTIARKVREV